MTKTAGLFCVLAVWGATGCATTRRFELSTAEARSAAVFQAPQSWSLGEVHVRVAPSESVHSEWGEGRTQLQSRLQATLAKAQAVSLKPGAPPAYTADVVVEVRERGHVNGWLALGIALEATTFAAGTWAGTEIALAAGANPIAGLYLGLAAAIAPAIALGVLPPSGTVHGTLEGQVTARRASDGASVCERHATRDWSTRTNYYQRERALARASGEAAELLEVDLLEQVRTCLERVPASG